MALSNWAARVDHNASPARFNYPVIQANPILQVLSGAAQTGVYAAEIDLFGDSMAQPHGNNFVLNVLTQNGQGTPATSPGAAVTVTIKYAFATTPISPVAAAPLVFPAIASSLACVLPDSNSAAIAGYAQYSTDIFPVMGRYLYVWLDMQAFAANAQVLLTVNLVSV